MSANRSSCNRRKRTALSNFFVLAGASGPELENLPKCVVETVAHIDGRAIPRSWRCDTLDSPVRQLRGIKQDASAEIADIGKLGPHALPPAEVAAATPTGNFIPDEGFLLPRAVSSGGCAHDGGVPRIAGIEMAALDVQATCQELQSR